MSNSACFAEFLHYADWLGTVTPAQSHVLLAVNFTAKMSKFKFHLLMSISKLGEICQLEFCSMLCNLIKKSSSWSSW